MIPHFNHLLQVARKADVIGIDTETTGLRVKDGIDYGLGIAIAVRGPAGVRGLYLPYRHQYCECNLDATARDQVKELIEAAPNIVMHNAKFDLATMRGMGIQPAGIVWDTMQMTHILNENLYSYDLDAVAERYLSGDNKKLVTDMFKMWIRAFGWATMPYSLVKDYAAQDACLTLRLYEVFRQGMYAEGVEKFWIEVEEPFLRLINDMERRGVRIDQDLCANQAAIGESRMKEITDELGINPGSPGGLYALLIEQIGLPIVKRSSKTGKPSFDKEAMEIYDLELSYVDNPVARTILEYRGWQKAVSSNYKPYLELVGPDGRLRPNFKLHGTTTGRLSCERPNLQQIPRVSDKDWNGSLKQAFIPDEGFILVEFDYAQLELRLGAAYGHIQSLLDVFKADRDVFTEMAAALGMSRQNTKTLVYSMQYGAGVNRIMRVFGVDVNRATQIRDNYFLNYPEFYNLAQKSASIALQRKKIKLWSGRYRHFVRPQDEAHKAWNSVIQGGAADLVKASMLRLRQFESDDARMLLQVHDSVVWEIREDIASELAPQIKHEMEAVVPDFGVKFKVEAKTWGSG